LHLTSLILSHFRNFSDLSLSFSPSGAVFIGKNGSGKTNLLESIHLLCIGRSQRKARRNEMIQTEQHSCFVKGLFSQESSSSTSEAVLGFSRDKKVQLLLNGEKVTTFRDWFNHSSVVSFGPADISLITGAPGDRRRFLDILISQIDRQYMEHLLRYQSALQNRNKILQFPNDEYLFEIYENQMVSSGLYIVQKRDEVVTFCKEKLASFYREISGGNEAGTMSYSPCLGPEKCGKNEWKDVFFKSLKNGRKKDCDAGYTYYGPHRDSIRFSLDNRSAKSFGSQGQCRSLALSLRLSSVVCIESFKAGNMIFLVDDAFSELDDERIAKVYPLIRDKGQVFITSPVQKPAFDLDKPVFRISQGVVSAE